MPIAIKQERIKRRTRDERYRMGDAQTVGGRKQGNLFRYAMLTATSNQLSRNKGVAEAGSAVRRAGDVRRVDEKWGPTRVPTYTSVCTKRKRFLLGRLELEDQSKKCSDFQSIRERSISFFFDPKNSTVVRL